MDELNNKIPDIIYILHHDWEGFCYFKNDKIYRDGFDDEYGYYSINYNKLTINWNKWSPEDFYNINIESLIYYSKNIYENNYKQYLLIDISNDFLIIYNIHDKQNNKFNIWNKIFLENINELIISDNLENINKKNIFLFKNKNLNNTFFYKNYEDYCDGSLIINNILTLNFNKNQTKYYKNIDSNIYSETYTINKFLAKIDIKELYPYKYIFNKNSLKFYNINNLYDQGTYKVISETIYINWENIINSNNEIINSNISSKKYIKNKQYTNINYINQYNLYNDIKIIKPNKILINNKVLFSNISLCKTKIILSSVHYKYNNWNLENIRIDIKNAKILKKTIYDNDNYETSITIILEIDKEVDRETVYISYNNEYKYKIHIEQLKINISDISAMTLFKDDYELIKTYLKYYSNLGVEVFFLYYNGIIDSNIVEKIKSFNSYNYKIYLIEWDYLYWWFYNNNEKHHHSQTMAINDSLNILKNYSNYILYNDLDEYFILGKYKSFNELIINNDTIDIFVFKNKFCTIGKDLIEYKNFYDNFDLSNIIEGNYWDKYREKNLIKCKNINVMGVHNYFHKFNKNEIIEKNISYFLHILNFYEKNRLNLMTEYIR
jgi:hypothetical protein